MNRVEIMGNLTGDPQIREVTGKNGEQIIYANYRLAVNRPGKRLNNAGEANTDFIPVVASGARGKFAKDYLKKGMRIAVTGSLRTSNYTNKEGKTVFTMEVMADGQFFCEKKAAGTQTPGSASVEPEYAEGDTDLPLN